MSHKLILVAADNPLNQSVAVMQLQELGYRADVVADGHKALEALTRISYDLVLMDCQMTQMDGYAATAEVRRREGTAKHTPVIAMSAQALESDRAKCIAAGMNDYISKPLKLEELAQVLERVFAATSNATSLKALVPVDLERLYESLGTEPEELAEILKMYLEQTAQNLERLQVAIAASNAGEIDLIAHNCAGVSANCGMVAIVEPLRELESMGRENRLEGATGLGLQVAKEFERMKIFLQENLTPVTV